LGKLSLLGALALLNIGLADMSDAQDAATPPSQQSAPAEAPSKAMEAATANRARMKTRPKFLDGPKAELPDAEKAAGHNGTAIISGIVDATGAFTETRVRQSTGAPALDQIALDAAKASHFTPAKDAAGAALDVPVSMSFDFYASQSDVPGGGLVHYQCDQFVRDTDWWHSAHPAAKWSDYQLYTFMVGFWVLYGGPANDMTQRLKSDPVEADWPHWIEACRSNPTQLFVDQTGALREPLHKLAGALRKSGKN
jgi:TonB family protein